MLCEPYKLVSMLCSYRTTSCVHSICLPEDSRLLEYEAVSLVDSFVTFQKEALSSSRVRQSTIKLDG